MPALHIRDVSEETIASLKRRAHRHGRSVQQELRNVLDRVAAEPLTEARRKPLNLNTVDTGVAATFDRADLYGDDER
ncbi:FitA-like ribbon-helix-helix domain-containing protein [Gordonia spumicola]|nr:plasmid stabilization protein [Gordonia spumicola]